MSLKLTNISKIYPNGVEALKNIHLAINNGEFLALVGPSGCGKSTLLRIIAGLEELNSGSIEINEKDITNSKPADRKIGMVFQNYALYPHLTVFENIAFPLSIKKENRYTINDKVKNISKILELDSLLDRKPKELSGGQRQRVALGRALIKEPDLFLFDEPLSNLDAKLRNSMRDEIVNIHKKIGISSVYVTHDQVEAMTMADKIAVMNKGEIMQFDTPYNIYNSPKNLFTAEFIGSPKINTIKLNININKLPDFLNDKNLILKDGNYTLAIRPENIRINEEGKYKAKFIKSEFYGNEWIYTCEFENSNIKIKSNIAINTSPNSFINFDYDKYLIFDSNEDLLN